MSPTTELEIINISETTSFSCRFKELRSLKWRIDLGILPSSSSLSVDEIRRVTANSRRRYAALRRQVLVDPQVPKDGSSSPDSVMDNPLSQDPDSIWGRFFRNAELEKMVDQDLTRLYPERGSYFQSSRCQGILRRVLLLWCLRNPEYGYRQGMHELLAPLLYVLHVDVERLSEVRKLYEDHFTDKFDGFSFQENDLTFNFDFKKFSGSDKETNGVEKDSGKTTNLTDLDPEIQTIVSLSDAYGAEGELGVVLSEKFMEHDTYSMFDALMSGAGGVFALREFFSFRPVNSQTALLPVIEACASLYHLLSLVDSSLYSHLVELGVEPQYFALRWLRVLFGREFSLEDLLLLWDEIFACKNNKITEEANSSCGVLESPRGAFVSSFAVSMMLHLRSSLFASETATSCLQRLLNIPNDVKLVKLITKAKSLQNIAANAIKSTSLPVPQEKKSAVNRGHSLSLDLSSSPKTPSSIIPESYWEEKWRVLQNEEQKQGDLNGQVSNRKKGWSERVKFRLSRTGSVPSPSKTNEKTPPKPSVRRSLLNDLARQLGSGDEDIIHDDRVEVEDQDNENTNEETTPKPSVGRSLLNDLTQQLGSGDDYISHDNRMEIEDQEDENFENVKVDEHDEQDITDDNFDRVEVNNQNISDENFGNTSEVNSLSSSDIPSPVHGYSDNENESGRNSIASNSSICETDVDSSNIERVESCPLPLTEDDRLSSKCSKTEDSKDELATDVKLKNILSGRFQWLWKLGRNANEGTSERRVVIMPENAKGDVQNRATADGLPGTGKGETADQNMIASLKNLGQSMLDNIQVIESIFQQDRAQTGSSDNLLKNVIVGKGQVSAMSALAELRKISNLLSEM